MRRSLKPLVVAGVAATTSSGLLAVTAFGVPLVPESPRAGSLTEVGPTADHGFPAWYRDSNGIRLEACTTLDDPLCSTLPDEVPNPDAPVSYPDNFPGEFSYQLAGAQLTVGGADVEIGMDLEGAWANEEVKEGDQIVFGRVRIRAKDIADGRYRVTHPYGQDQFVADGEGINFTQDIGVNGGFGQALTSRVGPFLQWDPAVAPAAPAGYVGDPGIDHKVIGSPYGTNYVAVEQFDEATQSWSEVGRTDVFSIQGRKATNAGLNVDKATYTVGADGKGTADVYASSDAGNSLQVKNTDLGFLQTIMRGSKGKYYARLPLTAAPDGKSVEVINASDMPVATKTAKLVDLVKVTEASYDATAKTLKVAGSSSDQDSTPGTLTALGQTVTAEGTVIENVEAPPATLTVISDKGGETTVPVITSGDATEPSAPVAVAIPSTQLAAPGTKVTLTGPARPASSTATSGPRSRRRSRSTSQAPTPTGIRSSMRTATRSSSQARRTCRSPMRTACS
jgi:hypothetical protein